MQASNQPYGYYRKREQQEREMAAVAKDETTRRIHMALADKYRRLTKGGDSLS